jgi:hypothetical protein
MAVMALDRGVLANIDRRLFAELSHDAGPQMVKVPLSDAAWSTWRRYCDVLGLTMGEGIAALIDSELAGVVDHAVDGDSAELALRAGEQLAAREREIAARVRDLKAVETRLGDWNERLLWQEAELRARELRVERARTLAVQSRGTAPKVGRNDRCPCGSGLKYKHCHGLSGRLPEVVPR